ILKILGEKPTITVQEMLNSITTPSRTTPLLHKEGNKYAVSRSLKNLVDGGLATIHNSDNETYVKLTKIGKNKVNSLRLLGDEALVPKIWDGFWRIIILDLSEDRKSERESLRYLLKKANFVCIKNTVWISPHPYEHLFANIKKDLSLTTELMIIVTDKLDEATSLAFFEAIKN
nr:hypothetical protein [bacterium]